RKFGFSEEPISGASLARKEILEGDLTRGGNKIGKYFQGYVHLRVPEENFAFTPERCLKKAQSLIVQGNTESALQVMGGAHFFWPDDIKIRERLAMIQERAGCLGDALQTLESLLQICPPEDRDRVQKEIQRIEKVYAGGEFAYQEKKLRDVLAKTSDLDRLILKPIKVKARPGEFIDYTIWTDKPYEYFAIWLDADGLFLYPANQEESGRDRLGNEEGAENISLDVGGTLGPHLFVLIASIGRASWFREISLLREDVNRRVKDSTGELPYELMAEIIEDIKNCHDAGSLVTAGFDFDVVP
ncbi:MAG: hypothetical protein ABIK28_22730, partial [Planctomycetota bacterium]